MKSASNLLKKKFWSEDRGMFWVQLFSQCYQQWTQTTCLQG
uniref:Uncharacterized protein n=1 Tax=Anguilla anguilla TaxID=7936 RepID=A0A0E9PAX7_ANGAN